MKTIDFSLLNDGEQFEDLCEDLFKEMGYTDPPPERSGRGPDAGRDFIITEHRKSDLLDSSRHFRWLVECKNFAKSNKSVQPGDVDCITDKIIRHGADGYLLVTTTVPSINLEKTIKAINLDKRLGFEASCWAKTKLIDELLKHRKIYEKYFGSPVTDTAVLTHWSKHNPFLELISYQEVQAKYFFGREAEIRNLAERLCRDNLVLVCGESGVGKTSLIQAGVLPLLRQDGFRVVNITVDFRFNIENLLYAVKTAVQDLPELCDSLDSDNSTASDEALRKVAEMLCVRNERLIIFLDQFESLFQNSSEVSVELCKILPVILSFAKKYHSFAFLISARADYLNEIGIWVDEYQIPDIWRNHYHIQKLKRSQAIQVLKNVPPLVNAEFSLEVIEAITSDLEKLDKGQIYPPNLQIVASRVFEKSRMQTNPKDEKLIISLSDYEFAGGTEGVLESFLNEKLGEFKDRDLAHRILLELVTATGRRQSLSLEYLSERLSQPALSLKTLIDKLISARLVRPVEQTGLYELVHDILAIKVLETTEEEQRKAKAVLEAFALAVNTWKTDHIFESAQKLDLYYMHRHSLNIGEEELLFLLFSERKEQDSFSLSFHNPSIHEKRLRWVNLSTPSVCISALNLLLQYCAAVQKGNTSSQDNIVESLLLSSYNLTEKETGTEILSDLCGSSSFEAQKQLVELLGRIEKESFKGILYQAYQTCPFLSPASLSYLQDLVCKDLSPDIQKSIACRILNYYLSKFPLGGWRDSQREEWRNQFPQMLLTNPSFRNIAFKYLLMSSETNKTINRVDWRVLNIFRIEMFKLLHEHDPQKTIKAMWDVVNAKNFILKIDSAILNLLRIYDPEKTVDEVVRLVGNYPLHHVDLLKSMEAPETDAILIKGIESFVNRYKNGSNMVYGGGILYERSIFREVVKAVGQRRLQAVVPLLAAAAIRYEHLNLKLDCIEALVNIGGEEIIDTLVDLLDDGFSKVRGKASKYLCRIKEQSLVVKKVVNSIREQKESEYKHNAKRSDAIKTKIYTLGRLRATEAIETLESIASNDSDMTVREAAMNAVNTLKKTSLIAV